MAIVKRYNLRGMATKIDDLYKDPEFATDTLNVYKDCSGRIIGRNGTLKYLSLACDDMYYSREKQEHYAFSDVLKKSSDGITFSNVPAYYSTNSGKINQSKKSVSENSGYMFFSDTENSSDSIKNPVMKYDGYGLYQAGLPELTAYAAVGTIGTSPGFNISYVAGATKVYFKIAQYSVGVFGDLFIGPVASAEFSCDNISNVLFNCMLMKDINTANSTMFNDRFIAKESTVSSITGTTIQFSVSLVTNYVAGDYITLQNTTNGELKTVKIASVDVPNLRIIIDSSSTGFDSILLNYGVVVFYSYDDVEYKLSGSFELSPYDSAVATHTPPTGFVYFITDRPSIDEFLNTEDSRVKPLKCKYLSNFGDLLFSLNLQDEVNSITKSSSLPYSICFSSQGEGSSAETFNYSNIITIGTSDEGEITGASVVDNNMIIFKERSSYLLTLSSDGTPGRLIKLSSIVGCVSNKSIVNFEGSVAWLSDKGIYAQSGSKEPQELTAQIENIFTDNPYNLKFSESRVAIDRFNELLMFYIPHTSDSSLDRVLVFSFKWKEWFWFMSIDGSNGFYHTGDSIYFNDSAKLSKLEEGTINNDSTVDAMVVTTLPSAVGLNGKVYFVESTNKFYKSNNVSWVEQSLADTTAPINHYYKSGWENLGAAGIEKKFNNMLVFSIQNPSISSSYDDWKLKVSSEYDWNSATIIQCDDEKSFSATNRRNFYNIDKTACYSRRFTFQNNNASEGFWLSGYEFEAQQPQQRIRD